jgi:hypothetical protein
VVYFVLELPLQVLSTLNQPFIGGQPKFQFLDLKIRRIPQAFRVCPKYDFFDRAFRNVAVEARNIFRLEAHTR